MDNNSNRSIFQRDFENGLAVCLLSMGFLDYQKIPASGITLLLCFEVKE